MKALSTVTDLFYILHETHQSLADAKKSTKSIKELKMLWAQKILQRLNFDIEFIGQPITSSGTLFLGNHISYIDIPILMSIVENISFVAKKELSNWPIFGAGAKTLDTVFVNRENGDSRNTARMAIQNALSFGKRVLIFPSGTTCIDNSKKWRKGAFEIAEQTGCQIQAFRIQYEPLREVAFIDEDFFLIHLYKLLGEKKIKAKIEFAQPLYITNPIKDCQHWQNWAQFKI
jgi:1-acyl-sn-glycerol-3-phosphate acyltransferase